MSDTSGSLRTADSALADRTLLDLATALLKHRHMIVLTVLLAGAAVIAVSLLSERDYTTKASFVPQAPASSRIAGLSGLAAQLGIGNLASGAPFGSPDLYRQILQTREILGAIADDTFSIDLDGRPVHTLAGFWRVSARDSLRVREKVIRRLAKVIDVRVEPRTQLVRLSVTTSSPTLSRHIAQRALDLIDEFNQQKHQSQSAQEARFVGERLAEARDELRSAEDALARFMIQNRDFRTAPLLLAQYERLGREVNLRQAVYTTLAQGYEQARIEEVRDTPVITVVERPVAPPVADPRHLLLKLALAVIGGATAGVLLALAREFTLAPFPGGAGDAAALWRELAHTRAELRRPWLLLGVGAKRRVDD